MYDYHMHSQFSPDASMTMKNAIEQSLQNGLQEICFTDHLDYDYDGHGNDIAFDIPKYIETLVELQQQYQGRIQIKIGAEFGLQPHVLNEYQQSFSAFPFDFIIGSIHSVEKSDLYMGNFFQNKTQKQAYLKYFEDLLYILDHFENFSVLGHLDVIKRYGSFDVALPLEDYREATHAILKKVIQMGKGIELNTSGIRYQLGDYHPSMDIMKMYHELGGEIITLGSDAHKTNQISFDFPNALRSLQDVGFQYICSFDQMQPQFHRINKVLDHFSQ